MPAAREQRGSSVQWDVSGPVGWVARQRTRARSSGIARLTGATVAPGGSR